MLDKRWNSVGPTLDQRWTPTMDQRWSNKLEQRHLGVHKQRWSNVAGQRWTNVARKNGQRWSNVGPTSDCYLGTEGGGHPLPHPPPVGRFASSQCLKSKSFSGLRPWPPIIVPKCGCPSKSGLRAISGVHQIAQFHAPKYKSSLLWVGGGHPLPR